MHIITDSEAKQLVAFGDIVEVARTFVNDPEQNGVKPVGVITYGISGPRLFEMSEVYSPDYSAALEDIAAGDLQPYTEDLITL